MRRARGLISQPLKTSAVSPTSPITYPTSEYGLYERLSRARYPSSQFPHISLTKARRRPETTPGGLSRFSQGLRRGSQRLPHPDAELANHELCGFKFRRGYSEQWCVSMTERAISFIERADPFLLLVSNRGRFVGSFPSSSDVKQR